MNKNEIFNKWISFCIASVFLLFAFFLSAFFWIENTHIQKVDLSSLPVSYGQCNITAIAQEDNVILIEGVFSAQDQYLNSVNLSCIISDSDENSSVGYRIPTEFFEVCDEQTIDTRQRSMAGFRARIDLDFWEYGEGIFDIFLLNRCNEYNELIRTENHVQIGGTKND